VWVSGSGIKACSSNLLILSNLPVESGQGGNLSGLDGIIN
jgi:hypothetical protein